MDWKWGCQPFSCRCSQKWLTAEKRFVLHVCLRNPCLLILFWNLSLHSLPEAWVPWERQYVPQLCITLWLHHAHPFVAAAEKQKKVVKACLMQRSRGFGHWVMASKICCNAVIVLSVVPCCCCKPMNSWRDWAFSNSGLEVGLPAFQRPMFAKVTHCRQEICSTCLSKESMPFDPFVKSKPPLPTRSLRSLRAVARSTLLQYYSTIQWLCSHSCYVTAANQRTVVEIELLATVGWKWGCQPFSCPCSQEWLTAQKRFVPHVCPRNPCLLILLWNLSLHSLPEAWGPWER